MKKKIAVITGGSSGELEISLASAQVIARSLHKDLYNVYTVVIKGNDWIYTQDDGQQVLVDKNDFSLNIGSLKITFDCVFIAIHGTPGEDGKLQGYFDMLGLPYTACDVFTSALTFNKYFANQVIENLGVKSGKMMRISVGEIIDEDAIIAFAGFPCFVKPNKGGSSVGITKVKSRDEIMPAIEAAFLHDDEALVHEFLPGVEITCGVCRRKDELLVLPLAEIISKKEFFDFEAKYTHGMADEIVPARISEKLTQKCNELSSMLYEELNCKGIVRFDYILAGDDFYFLEVNSIPGLTANSIVPRMARYIGINLEDLFSMVIEEAMHWHAVRAYK